MARHLLKKQKNIIDKFIKENTNAKESFQRSNSVFAEGRHHLDADDLPEVLYETIAAINDTEVLYQNIDRYMADECARITYE